MLYIHTCHICWMAVRWFLQWWCSCKDCGFFHCGGRNNWFRLLSILPYLRQCFFYVVNALQCKISPWYRHWPPNLHNRPTVTWFLWILWIFRYMLALFALGEEAAWSLKTLEKEGGVLTYKDSMKTCCLSCCNVFCAVVKEYLHAGDYQSVHVRLWMDMGSDL